MAPLLSAEKMREKTIHVFILFSDVSKKTFVCRSMGSDEGGRDGSFIREER